MKETIDLLVNEVNSGIEALDSMEYGSEEYGKAVTDTGKLIDKMTDLKKLESEINEKELNRQERQEDRVDKKSSDKKSFWIDIAKIGVPLLSAALLILHDDKLAKDLMYFEKNDILKSTASRNFFSTVLRRKR